MGTPEVVLEGAARDAEPPPGLVVHRAAGSGDDEVVARAGGDTGVTVLVVTADRGLRDRLPGSRPAAAAPLHALGPGELLGWLDAPDPV